MTETETKAPAAPKARRRGTKGTPPAPDNVLGALSETPAAKPPAPVPSGHPAEPVKAPTAELVKAKKDRKAKERTEPLNFRVTVEFRKAFKRAAAAQDCKKVELLERIFTEWQARNPG